MDDQIKTALVDIYQQRELLMWGAVHLAAAACVLVWLITSIRRYFDWLRLRRVQREIARTEAKTAGNVVSLEAARQRGLRHKIVAGRKKGAA